MNDRRSRQWKLAMKLCRLCIPDYVLDELEWTTVFGYTLGMYVTSHPGQLILLPTAGHEISTDQCDDALWVGSKGRMGHSINPFVDQRVGCR